MCIRDRDEIAARQGDESGQRCALVAALILVHLDDEFLAFLERFLDGSAVRLDAFTEIGA
mgnify:CR=1 FL=1